MFYQYHATTKDRSYTTTSARDAADVAHTWARRGEDAAVYVTAYSRDGVLHSTEVPMAATIAATAKAATALRRSIQS